MKTRISFLLLQEGRDDDNDNDVGEVIFDEFGVVTDQEKLKRLRHEKERERLEKTRKHKKKSSKSKEEEKSRKHGKHKKRKRSKRDKSQSQSDSDGGNPERKSKTRTDIEDGEISSSSTSSSTQSSNSESEEEEKRKVQIFKSAGRFQGMLRIVFHLLHVLRKEIRVVRWKATANNKSIFYFFILILDIAKKYPPSLRIVVQESNLEGLKVGSLSLITFKGGSLGREGNHDVIIPDVNVSKVFILFTTYRYPNSILNRSVSVYYLLLENVGYLNNQYTVSFSNFVHYLPYVVFDSLLNLVKNRDVNTCKQKTDRVYLQLFQGTPPQILTNTINQ